MEDLKGFQFDDGVHWQYKGKDVAVINWQGEIEWCVRTFTLPKEIVEEIRDCKPKPSAKWVIEVFKKSRSTTQGYYTVTVNGDEVAFFGGDKKIINGKWDFTIPDEELGRLVISASEKIKDKIWRNEK